MCALRPPSAGRLADMALAFHPQISPKAEVPLSPPRGEGQQARSPATLSKLETRRAGRRGAHLPLQASEPTSCPQGWAALSAGEWGKKDHQGTLAAFEGTCGMGRSHACRESPSGMWDVPVPARLLCDQVRRCCVISLSHSTTQGTGFSGPLRTFQSKVVLCTWSSLCFQKPGLAVVARGSWKTWVPAGIHKPASGRDLPIGLGISSTGCDSAKPVHVTRF